MASFERKRLQAILDETHDRLDRLRGFQAERTRRGVEALAVAIEVGGHSLERTGAVENGGAEPEGMRPRPGHQDIAFVPVPIQPCPGLGPLRHLSSPLLPRPMHRRSVMAQKATPTLGGRGGGRRFRWPPGTMVNFARIN